MSHAAAASLLDPPYFLLISNAWAIASLASGRDICKGAIVVLAPKGLDGANAGIHGISEIIWIIAVFIFWLWLEANQLGKTWFDVLSFTGSQ